MPRFAALKETRAYIASFADNFSSFVVSTVGPANPCAIEMENDLIYADRQAEYFSISISKLNPLAR